MSDDVKVLTTGVISSLLSEYVFMNRIIPDGSSIDDVKQSGFYSVSHNTFRDMPFGLTYCNLIVFALPGKIMQILIRFVRWSSDYLH